MTVNCPNCKKKAEWIGNPWRPFCSERCKLIDLGAWASEQYRIESTLNDESDDDSSLKETDHG